MLCHINTVPCRFDVHISTMEILKKNELHREEARIYEKGVARGMPRDRGGK